MAGYPNPPHEPPGGWKNDAQWIGNVQRWAEDMIRMGFGLKDVMKIYQDDIGEPFPKNLKNTILGNDWLFPGQDAMYEYDLDNHMKRHYTYNSPETESGKKGPFEWISMSPSEIDAATQYFHWRDDPRNSWMFGATAEDPEGHPYQAWLQQWGERWKDPAWTPPEASGKATMAQDIFKRPGYDASGRPINTPRTTGPSTIPTVTPGREGMEERGDNKPGRGEDNRSLNVSTAPTSAPNLTGYGNPVPFNNINTTPQTNSMGWSHQGLDPNRRRRKNLLNTSTASNPYFTF